MDEKQFAERLTMLRARKNVSARDMSLSIGQSPGYINGIENGKSMPSMTTFFYICEFLGVTPKQFFDLETSQPFLLDQMFCDIKKLSEDKQKILIDLVQYLK